MMLQDLGEPILHTCAPSRLYRRATLDGIRLKHSKPQLRLRVVQLRQNPCAGVCRFSQPMGKRTTRAETLNAQGALSPRVLQRQQVLRPHFRSVRRERPHAAPAFRSMMSCAARDSTTGASLARHQAQVKWAARVETPAALIQEILAWSRVLRERVLQTVHWSSVGNKVMTAIQARRGMSGLFDLRA